MYGKTIISISNVTLLTIPYLHSSRNRYYMLSQKLSVSRIWQKKDVSDTQKTENVRERKGHENSG